MAKTISKRRKKINFAIEDVWPEIIYNDKPNCPKCNKRDYKIIQHGSENGSVKFYAKCICKQIFIYCKEMSSIKEGTTNEDNTTTFTTTD